jgi:hypothetical protein
MVIQTHGRNGQYNPHLHCLATSGGWDHKGKHMLQPHTRGPDLSGETPAVPARQALAVRGAARDGQGSSGRPQGLVLPSV